MSDRVLTRPLYESGSSELLCLDLGNSRLKALLFGGAGPKRWAMLPAAASEEDWERELGPLADAGAAVALSSVNPSRGAALKAWLDVRRLYSWELRGDSPVPFPVAVRGRETLGADRLCNAAAAWAEGLAPALIADAGSALTLDVIDAAGCYLGGLILPGSNLMLAALARGTGQLPHIEAEWPEKIIGEDTRGALAAGASWGLLSALEGLVRRLRRRFGEDCSLVMTGGWGDALADRWEEGSCRLEPDWTLMGLKALFDAAQS